LLICWDEMRVALTDLDDGKFLSAVGWTSDCRLASTFPDTEEVSRRASDHKIRNAAAAMVDGFPQKPVGFIWLTEPTTNSG
jgi:hypothetical protein